MISCKNCGHDCHCGDVMKISDPPHTQGESIVVICRHCRCEKCENEDKLSQS